MTEEQITEICNLMAHSITKELGLRCGHRSQGPRAYRRPYYQTPGKHDFFVDLPTGANGDIKARLFAGYHTSTVSVYGTDFREMREKIRARQCETANLAIDRFEVRNWFVKFILRVVAYFTFWMSLVYGVALYFIIKYEGL